MKTLRTAAVLASLMVVAAVGGIAAKPSVKATVARPRFVLADVIPRQFGAWHELSQQGGQIVNPQTQELLDKLYSQILSRTYVNDRGYRIMLSLAYGDDQRGGLQAHKPEICYPAQGFKLQSNVQTRVVTPFGPIDARRLSTSLGERKEPVTYWFTVGERAVKNKLQQRIEEIRLGLTGQVPDGLLFRVSSIDDTPERAYAMQDGFVADLLASTAPEHRLRLSGLNTAKATP